MLHSIGDFPVGADAPLFVVAEIGLNHGGSVERALQLVDAAADAGASAIKLQTIIADQLVSARAPAPRHVAAASMVDFFRQFELDEAAHAAVFARARTRGLATLATPFSEHAVEMLERIGIDGYKIASGDITYLSLIERAARTGRPLVISTGMSTLDEVGVAVDTAHAAGARDLALLHCVSCYPVPAGHEHLRIIQELAHRFGVPVGLSDHGEDPIAAALAVALGASIYERHFVLRGDDESVDRAVSSTPTELAEIVRVAERARISLGDGRKRCLPVESVNRIPSRRSLRAARALEPGELVGADDIVALRPGDGLACAYFDALVGTQVRRPIAAHEAFVVEDVVGLSGKVPHAV